MVDLLQPLTGEHEEKYQGNNTMIICVPRALQLADQPKFMLSSTNLRVNWPSNQVLQEMQKRVYPNNTANLDKELNVSPLEGVPSLMPLPPLRKENLDLIAMHSSVNEDESRGNEYGEFDSNFQRYSNTNQYNNTNQYIRSSPVRSMVHHQGFGRYRSKGSSTPFYRSWNFYPRSPFRRGRPVQPNRGRSAQQNRERSAQQNRERSAQPNRGRSAQPNRERSVQPTRERSVQPNRPFGYAYRRPRKVYGNYQPSN